MTHQELQLCIEACLKCAQECEHCADACMHENESAHLADCIRLNRDCAETCWTAAAFMSRRSKFANDFCRVCAEICEACSETCRSHEMEHCQVCANACQQCAEECRRMIGDNAFGPLTDQTTG